MYKPNILKESYLKIFWNAIYVLESKFKLYKSASAMFKSNIIYLFSVLLLGRFHRLRINEDKNKSALEK